MSAPEKALTGPELAEIYEDVRRTRETWERLTLELITAARELRDAVTERRPRQAITSAQQRLFRVVEEQNAAAAMFVSARMKREAAVATLNGGATK